MPPGTRQEVLDQAGNNDIISLKPHTNIHKDANDKADRLIVSYFFRPKCQRKKAVTKDHHPKVKGVRPYSPFLKDGPLVFVSTVPADKKFYPVSIKYDG